MQEASVQKTLTRLLQAESEAQSLIDSAEKDARQTVAEARSVAQERLATAQEQGEATLQRLLQQAKAETAAGTQERLEAIEAEIDDLKKRADVGFDKAVGLVARWVTQGGW